MSDVGMNRAQNPAIEDYDVLIKDPNKELQVNVGDEIYIRLEFDNIGGTVSGAGRVTDYAGTNWTGFSFDR